jgi:1-acyl-sn-glycerol-3-phosphate acyltransferase
MRRILFILLAAAHAGAALIATHWSMLVGRLMRRPRLETGRIISRIAIERCARIWHYLARALAVEVVWRLPEAARGQQAIVIANQRASISSLIVAATCRRLEMDEMRWVAIARAGRHPGIGPIYRYIAVFVNQDKRSNDTENVYADGLTSAQHGFGMVIFPEGRSWTPARAVPEWCGLLPPRRGGFDALCRAMPNVGILRLTMRWTRPRGG